MCTASPVGSVSASWIDEWISLNAMNYNDSGNNGNKNSDRYTIGKEETITVTITTLQRVTRNKYKHFSLFPSIHQHLFGDYFKQEKSDGAMLIHWKSFLASKIPF